MKACLKVLVIDDEDSVLSLVGGFLRDMGHEYEYASSGEAAQRLSKEALSTFDVAVVDWNMPGMNGFETAEYLRHLNPNLLYIMLTAHGTPAKITESFRLNFVGYLEKEIEFDAFKKGIPNGW
mgnify:CR=1 FL=1